MPEVVVVGGGISGLAAAWQLAGALPEVHVTVLEGAPETGGKLRTASVAGLDVDVGAESMLARRPDGMTLAREIGLGDRVVHPATSRASVWSHGALRPFPPGTLMGVPADPAQVLDVLSAAERSAIHKGRAPAPLTEDVSVRAFLEPWVGAAVVDRLVDPLLGGIYAGRAEALSLRATVPALWEAARAGESPIEAAQRAAVVAGAADPAPVFAGISGGVHRLAATLTGRLVEAGVVVRTRSTVTALERVGRRWRLRTGPAPAPVHLEADAVVIAVPATPAARLLRPAAPLAAAELGAVEYASLAIVTYAFRRSYVPTLPGSGFLVPAVEALGIKAATFSSAKWAWVDAADPDLVWLRVSVGRHGDQADLQHPDDDLVATGLTDLCRVLGARLPDPVDRHVQRWGGALPQYAVGYLDRVGRIQAAVAELPGLEVCGAAYTGVGIPACIASGRAAADAVGTYLRGLPTAPGE